VHVHNILNSWLCLPLRLLGHRVLFHLHGQEWRAAKWGPMMSLLMRLSILPMVYGAHVVVTVCEESRRLLSARFPRRATRIVCIPNGLPGPTRSATRSHAPFLADHGLAPDAFFLFAGRLVPQKRVELIVQALALSGSSFPLVLAGTGSYSTGYVATLEAEVRRRGLDGRVFFLGQLDWEQLRHLYANCRAVVHPSDSEGCSNTLLEAIATGTCVVCSDLPENRSLLGDAGLYIGRGDVDGLATTLRALEREGSVAERRRMVVARQRRLRSWDEIAPEFHRMYWPRPSDRPLKAARPAATLGVTRSDAA
jgi:glycosyltransferase involved in cell wall biosynthesis